LDDPAVENTHVDDGRAWLGGELAAADDEIELRHVYQIPLEREAELLIA
jgi:hypothetical protein